jgi:hypothetical protein
MIDPTQNSHQKPNQPNFPKIDYQKARLLVEEIFGLKIQDFDYSPGKIQKLNLTIFTNPNNKKY